MPQPAIRHGESNAAWFGDTYSDVHNLTGWPAVVVRGGTSPDGLPIGVQLVARPWREDVALAAARVVEAASGGWQLTTALRPVGLPGALPGRWTTMRSEMPEPSAPFSASPPTLTLGAGAAAYDERGHEGPRRGLGGAAVREGHVALVVGRPRPAGHLGAARLARRPGAFHRSDRRPRGLRRGIRDAGFTTADRRRDGRQQPRPGRAAARTFGATEDWLDAARPRLDRPGGASPRRSTTSTRSRRSSSSPASPARRPSRWPSSPTPGPGSRRPRAHHAPRFAHAGEMIAAISDPARASRRSPTTTSFRELFLNPPDIGGRYSVADVRRARAGQPDRAGPRRAARVGVGDARGVPRAGPESNPGVSLGLAIGTLAKNGRDKLTFLADGDDRELRRVG